MLLHLHVLDNPADHNAVRDGGDDSEGQLDLNLTSTFCFQNRIDQREGFRDIRTVSVRCLYGVRTVFQSTSAVHPPYVRTISGTISVTVSVRYPYDICYDTRAI